MLGAGHYSELRNYGSYADEGFSAERITELITEPISMMISLVQKTCVMKAGNVWGWEANNQDQERIRLEG